MFFVVSFHGFHLIIQDLNVLPDDDTSLFSHDRA
jgi:hypothetical protein